jgi:hypothetical protein
VVRFFTEKFPGNSRNRNSKPELMFTIDKAITNTVVDVKGVI